MDLREYEGDWEETLRTVFAGLQANIWHAMPGRLVQNSSDGHNAVVQITVKRAVTDVKTGALSYESHPIHPDTIVHFPGGARSVLTHGLAEHDEGLIVYANRDVDGWRQSGGEQQPVTNRMSGYQDPHLIPGIRSDPRKLAQVDTQAAHLRSEDKLHVHEMHPDRGHRTFSADPSTPAASPSFDPLSMASAFYHHLVRGASGLLGQAVSSGGTHEHGVTHSGGAFMRAFNGLHQVLAMPSGALLSAFSGAHTVTANASGVQVASSAGIALQCPPSGLSLPSGSIGGSSLAAGAASQNIGSLSGDLGGTLPSPTVLSIANLVGMDKLPRAASDAAAAALTPPVAVGSPYLNTSVKAGVGLLAIRIA